VNEIRDPLGLDDGPMPWVAQAACRGVPLEVFFPATNKDDGPPYEKARAICAVCPVRVDCATHYMATEPNHDRHGFAGGMSPRERRGLYRKRLRAPRAPRCGHCGGRGTPGLPYCSGQCASDARSAR
jgi:WhiB family redox-sensing transcriptional regulator